MRKMIAAVTSCVALISTVAHADWATSTGGTPSVPQICVANSTPYSINVSVNGQRFYVGPHYTTRVPSYENNALLVQMNTRQLSGPYNNPIWAQTYVYPAYYGCGHQNTVNIYLYGNVLGFN
jgi:hypothetical protein